MVGSLSITLILLTFLLSHDREHFAHLAGFIYVYDQKVKTQCLAVFSLVVVCMSEKRKNPTKFVAFFEKTIKQDFYFTFLQY